MKKLNPVTKGMAEVQFQRLEKFKIQFSNSMEFQLLNEQFQPIEVFKMNGDKFEIATVQRAFEDWLAELKPTPRANFIKDLDKLLSDDYVLVPRIPTCEMMVSALSVIATGIGKDHIDVEIITCWTKMLEASQGVSL